MGRERRAIRVFFSTYYEDDAARAIAEIERIVGGRVAVKRSSVVPELYYVEVPLGDEGREEAEKLASSIAELLSRVSDTIYGVKVYTVGV